MSSIGVIGLGAMGARHARVYKELGVLRYVCDMDLVKAKQIGELYQVPYGTTIDQTPVMLSAVSIATPTPFHVDNAVKCIDLGLNVLIEKPVAMDLASAQELKTKILNKRQVVGVGYIERYNPAFRALETLVKDGSLGEITSINIKRVGGSPRSADNVIMDLMTHDFNLLITLLERQPKSVHTTKLKKNGITNSAQVLMDFNGISATCESNWISPVKIRKLEVTGTKGYCEVNMITQQLMEYKSNTATDNPCINFQDFVQQYGTARSTVHYFEKEPLKEELIAFIKASELMDINSMNPLRPSGLVGIADAIDTLCLTLDAIKAGEQ